MSESTHNPDRMIELAHVTTYQSGLMQSKAHRTLNAYFARCLKTHNLTAMQWFIIGAVKDAGEHGITMSELAKVLGSTLPTLTEAASLLELKGWLNKKSHATDGRARMIVLSPDKYAQCDAIEQDLRVQLRKTIYAKINQADLATYVNVLYKLADI
jgi:DNA-binding MarR family transcriptional regulator